ncbi:TPA_asm: RNA-directed RNA polymerase [ssRNA phage SRR5466725_6]|uniref:RNA-directed RNA polymerase n=1 Tax=ssRNA phage SRR5466725_6 TaxID=2786425 RepID=A0A8S5KYI4_9VIRU|nr:RNA-directed RNA polymerase [ssRNA phage SRR5466725_6]DAD50830.1 TPA_asm: RNA-directed RNA polymerase [ssRNA phage SRR5466725_6]
MKIESIFRDMDMILSQISISCPGVPDDEIVNRLKPSIQSHLRVLYDCRCGDPIRQKLECYVRLYEHYSFLDVMDSLSELAFFCKTNANLSLGDVKGHLRDCNSFIPPLWSVLRQLIVDALHDVSRLRDLNQVCLYLTKVELTRPDLELKGLQDYITFEENYPHCNMSVALELRKIMEEWLLDYNPSNFPHHGGGATADAGRDAILKYALLGTDAPLRAMIHHCYHSNELDMMICDSRVLHRISRLQFVPKTYKKLRSISMEPCTLMYYQQGVKDNLYRYIHTHLDWCIRLEDQERNRVFAQLGSATGAYCTIDLTAASDSVGFELVTFLFKKTSLWPELLGTRSFCTELPDGSQIHLKKFAPMGSALCFPIETIIFAGICELVARAARTVGYTPTDFSIYGDDICCPSYFYDSVTKILIQLGFKPNMDKSFHTGPYRESCGREYYNGIDISVIKHRGWDVISMNPDTRDALIDHANLADGILPSVRRFCIALLKEKGLPPFFGDACIRSTSPTNYHLPRKWNRDLFRCEVRLRAPTVVEGYVPDDATTFLEWLRIADTRDPGGLTLAQLCIRPEQYTIRTGTERRYRSKWICPDR